MSSSKRRLFSLEVLEGFLLGGAFSLALFYPLLDAGIDRHLWADNFDPMLLNWTIAWGYHAIFELGDPSLLWHANSFYPHSYTLAYSDSLLSGQLFYAPLRALGYSTTTALYGTLIGFTVLGTALSNIALLRIGGFSRVERYIVLFSAHMCLSFTNFLSHHQLFGFQFAPGFLLFLYLFVTRWELDHLRWLSAAFLFAVCYSIYFGPMLVTTALLLALPFAVYGLVRGELRTRFFKLVPGGLLVLASLALLLYFLQLRPYLILENSFPAQDYGETIKYSAHPSSLFNEFSKHSYWYAAKMQYAYGDWEHAYFPGQLLLLLLLAGILAGALPWKDLKKKIPTSLYLFSLLVFFSAWILSCGPYLKDQPDFLLPFAWLAEIIPGFRSVRAPGRFGMLLGLPLGLLSVSALRILAGSPILKTAISLLLLAGIAVESLPKFEVYPFELKKKAVYLRLAEHLNPNEALIEVPIAGSDHFETLKNTMRQLNGSTYHWGRLVVGYGGKSTPEHAQVIAIDQQLQSGGMKFDELMNFAKRLKISTLLVHLDRYPPHIAKEVRERITSKRLAPLFEQDGSIALKIR